MKPPQIVGWLLTALGHIAATVSVAAVIVLLILPMRHVDIVAIQFGDVPELWQMSTTALMLHLALSACVWALLYIVYRLVALRVQERRSVHRVKLSRGSVITETLIVMPVFLLLSFGMGQLAINNVGGILANVAMYEAARAAWIWMPEEQASDRRAGVADGIAEEKCRIAVAFVMMPIAPGEALRNPSLGSSYADRARMMALGANVPLGGTISLALGSDVMGVAEGAVMMLSAGEDLLNENTYTTTLGTDPFWLRTIRKFTTAYLGAGCTINENDHSVQMTFKHHIGMPVVGPVFGTRDLSGVGNRPGYYATYTREFGLRKQINVPNNRLPQNEWLNPPSYDDTDFDPESQCTGDCP